MIYTYYEAKKIENEIGKGFGMEASMGLRQGYERCLLTKPFNDTDSDTHTHTFSPLDIPKRVWCNTNGLHGFRKSFPRESYQLY